MTGQYSEAEALALANRRQTLEPQEESHCTHECFTPAYVAAFPAPKTRKTPIGERPQLASDGLSTDTLAALTQALNMRGPLTPGATRPGILSYREVRRFTQQGGRSC